MTPRESEVLTVIKDYWAKHGYAPSYSDIMAVTGHKSKSGVTRLVASLKVQGCIVYRFGTQRSIKLVVYNCPHCGGKLP